MHIISLENIFLVSSKPSFFISQYSQTMDKGKLMSDLKERMRIVTPLPDEPKFTTSDETIVRYLKANDWKYKEAEKALLQTVEFRRETQPLRSDCKWCHSRTGYHSPRQVGHDESGRPVIYSNFAQAATHKNTVEDIIAHVVYLIENAKATMPLGTSSWVFIIDCTGMTLSACNPRIGVGIMNIFAAHYPERLGMAICVNHSALFHGVWKAGKRFLCASTVAKFKLVKSESKVRQTFLTYFSGELTTWLLDEMSLNSIKPLPQSQREFWNPPLSDHDTRGCPAYVKKYVNGFSRSKSSFVPGRPKQHMLHPNIIDALESRVKPITLNPDEEAERAEAMTDTYSSSSGDVYLDEISVVTDNSNYNNDNDCDSVGSFD